MRELVLFFILIAATALLAIACDRSDPSTTQLDGKANAFLGDEADADTESDSDSAPTEGEILSEDPSSSDEVHVDSADAPELDPDPLVVSWTDDAETTEKSELSFSVTNTSSFETFAIRVGIASMGVLGDAERALAAIELGPGESRGFEFAASSLPVRSDRVTSQMAVKLVRTVETPDGQKEWSQLEAFRFYRHAAGYEEARAYSPALLESELDGLLFETPEAEDPTTAYDFAAEEVGEKSDGAEKPKKVTFSASEMVVRDGAGEPIGFVVRAREESGEADLEGAVVTPEECADTETEVCDE